MLRRHPSGWRVLLLRAFRNWDVPKGLIESGEDPLAAALREVEEETSLTGLRFPWGEEWRETAPYAGGKIVRLYVAESPGGDVRLPINPALGRAEHVEWRWVGLTTAERMLAPRFAPMLAWARELVEAPRAQPG